QTDKEGFYEALELALHNFLKAKLNIHTNDISKEQITALLEEKNVTDEATTELIELLTSCEMARYAPSSVATTEVNYDKAVATITRHNKQIEQYSYATSKFLLVCLVGKDYNTWHSPTRKQLR